MNQISVSIGDQLVKTMPYSKNTSVQTTQESPITPFHKILERVNGGNQSIEKETNVDENQDESQALDATLRFLEKEGLEEIDGVFELLTMLKTNNQDEITNIEFIQQLLGNNPSETIKEAIGQLGQLLGSEDTFKEIDFTELPPAAEKIETLHGILNNGLAASFKGLTNEEKKAVLTLLNFGKLVVMSNEHGLSNNKATESVNQLASLLSKWKEKLTAITEKTKLSEATDNNLRASAIRDIGQKVYKQQTGSVPLNSKFGKMSLATTPILGKNTDIPVNQTVLIGDLQLQTQQQSPVLSLEKGGQTVGADEFIKSFESILSKANYTNQSGVQRLFVKLTPENLGTLQIELVQKDGQMVAKIIANTQKGKELLESHLQGLKVTLASQGISFDKIDFEQTADGRFQEEAPSEERRHQSENQAENETGNQEEEPASGFLSVLEDSMINQEI